MEIKNILKQKVNLIDFFRLVMKWNWLSARPLLGPLAMNRVWSDTMKRAGNEITKKLKGLPTDLDGLTAVAAEALGRFGITVEVSSPGVIISTECPIYNWMKNEKIEMVKYELPCGDIVCGALASGLVKGINPEYEVEVESRIEASLAKKEADTCTFTIKEAAQPLTIDEETCKHMFRNGHCAIFQFCPYNIGLMGVPPNVYKKYSDCSYYEPSMNKESIIYRERYLPEGNNPVTDGILRDRSEAVPHE